jgi:hypothetical protein
MERRERERERALVSGGQPCITVIEQKAFAKPPVIGAGNFVNPWPVTA